MRIRFPTAIGGVTLLKHYPLLLVVFQKMCLSVSAKARIQGKRTVHLATVVSPAGTKLFQAGQPLSVVVGLLRSSMPFQKENSLALT